MMSKFPVVPCGDVLFVEREKPEEKKSPGGLFVPVDSVSPDTAVVLAVGPDCADRVEVGDIIVLSKFSGADVNVGIDTYTAVSYRDILGIVSK